MSSSQEISRRLFGSRYWFAIFLALHLLPFAARPALIGGDEPHFALMAYSMATDFDLDLEDDYEEVEGGSKAAGRKRAGTRLERHLISAGGRQVFSHPLGLPALAAPLLFLQQRLSPGAAPDGLLLGLTLLVTFAALAAGWQLLEAAVGDGRRATFGLLALVFATPLWFYDRTFFTEPYVAALGVLALWCQWRHRPFSASLLLGLAFLLKETAALLILPFLLYELARHGWKAAARLALGPALALGLFGLKNLILYGEALRTFQPFRVGDPVAGILGLLVDPATGLLFFAPTAFVLAVGFFVRGPSEEVWWRRPETYAAFAFLGYFLLTAFWIDWKGGSGYGPRLLVPALPALGFPLVRLLRQGRWLRALAAATVAGFAVQWAAATDPVEAFWSVKIQHLVLGRPGMFSVGLAVGALLVWASLRVTPWRAARGARRGRWPSRG